jgi:2-oxoglutarate ferredoxin oxidoreductase subunit alpha
MRGGPGLGNLAPTQADYFQMTKGGGHGDYHPIVLAPSSVQEAVDLMYGAFELAEKYRTIVILAIDGNIGQMMEPVEMPQMRNAQERAATKSQSQGYSLTGAENRARRVITSLFLKPEELEHMNTALQAKDRAVRAQEVRWAAQFTDDAELVIVAFGSAARIAQTALKRARARGLRVGLFRPISLYPFPEKELARLSKYVNQFMVVEMSAGQMIEDVRLAVKPNAGVRLLGKMGGLVPMPDEILTQIEQAILPVVDTTISEREALMAAYL